MEMHEIIAAIEQMAEDAANEKRNPIEALGLLRMLDKASSAAKAVIDPLALQAAEPMGKEFTVSGMRWRKNEGARKFIYDGVPAIRTLQDQLKLEQEKSQLAAKMVMDLRAKVDADGYAYTDDGDVIGVPAKVTHTKSSLVLVG